MYEDQSEALRQVEKDRQVREQMARKLRQEAIKQGLMAIEGLFALPAVVALSAASWAMYAVAFLERGFEAFQRTSEQLERGVREERERDWETERKERERETTQPRA